ncbi:MAG: 2OG-Fe(II) oxygenase [Xanthomonadaceae bacterium]|nr:2OG-Fe(II) oxygenase [Xanthomonadaceae bacterium]
MHEDVRNEESPLHEEALRIAADSGDRDAAFRLGVALIGHGDFGAAAPRLYSAAEAGHAGAMLEMGRLMLYGMLSVPDPRQAVHWFERAERAGAPAAGDFLLQIALGGIALPRDARINERLHRGVQTDYPPALLTAALHFGRKPHPDDQTLCLQLLERGAARGDVVAAALLAERLAHGEGCAPQPEAAEDLRAQCARDGFAPLPAFTLPPPGEHGPPRQLAMEDTLRAPAAKSLSEAPRVSVIDRLLSADECRLLIAASRPLLHPSQTADPITGVPDTMAVRTSHEASFDPLVETSAIRSILLRMAAASGIDLPQAEQLTVLHYGPGQQYRPHRDYLPASTLQMDRPLAGNRGRTVCVYLNPVEAGGETEFPAAGLKVAPMPGRAVIFDSMRFDDAHPEGRLDPDSLHAGLPVIAGEKWLATLWIRQRRYRDF